MHDALLLLEIAPIDKKHTLSSFSLVSKGMGVYNQARGRCSDDGVFLAAVQQLLLQNCFSTRQRQTRKGY